MSAPVYAAARAVLRVASELLLVLLCCANVHAAAPPLLVPAELLGVPGERVAPNLLLNLALTTDDAAAAFPGAADYRAASDYPGYFNAHMCYQYPIRPRTGGISEPDLSDANGYFSIAGPADARHECTQSAFSGNFLNWASMSRLDLLRYALTGGARALDLPGLTVLQRASLPDGKLSPDFYANPRYFARKVLSANVHRLTPFASATLYVVSCRDRILFSATAHGGGCDAARVAGAQLLTSDKYFGEFRVRVQVCSAADAADRADLCRAYGAHFKPEGVVQKYSGQLRIGLMSYLTEHGAQDPNLYGGVLRAALKFVGPTAAEQPAFAPDANAQTEWDLRTGVQFANPEHVGGVASGALNYINQTASAAPPSYRGAGPLAELYYEGLRYLQARPPSGAVAAVASDAGYPVLARRADPISAPCQRQLVATIGRGSGVEDRFVPGNSVLRHRDGARAVDTFVTATPLDASEATARVGVLQAQAGPDRAGDPDWRALARQDSGADATGSYYLAGLAYWTHTRPIRPDHPLTLDNYALELDAPDVPRASPMLMAAKYGGFAVRDGDAAQNMADAAHPVSVPDWSADGVRPQHWFAGADPFQLIGAVRALFRAASRRSGRVDGASLLDDRVGTEGMVFRVDYEQSDWSGSFKRYALLPDSDGGLRLDAAPLWDAGELLTGNAERNPAVPARPAPGARQIYTGALQSERTMRTIPFTWTNLSAVQRSWFDGSAQDGAPDQLGEARINFLRGERTRELGQTHGVFRRRSSVLGDSVHAMPVLVGAPSSTLTGYDHAAFYARYKNRTKAVYLGANDGMLHAFAVADGSELFAYVPAALLPKLSALTSPDYSHRAYVDATPAVGEAVLAGNWRSVLVSGMGMGAPGVFALDISDPAHFGAGPGALWEFTEQDDAAIGHVSGAPLIAKLKVGPDLYRHFVLVESGINNDRADPARHVGAAAGVLFMLALDKPTGTPWRLGVNYFKITTPILDAALPNALASPALALRADGSAQLAYAGDLQGNLWRFDLSATPPWSGPAVAQALFVARDARGQRQPITQAPKVVFAPGQGVLALFGTGKFIEAADALPSSFTPQSLYAVHDRPGAAPASPFGRADLQPRSLLAGADSSAGYRLSGADLVLDGADAKQGWLLDLPEASSAGERSVSSAKLGAGAVLFHTLLPGRDACAAPAARSYLLDAVSGLAIGADGSARSGALAGQLSQPGAAGPPIALALRVAVGGRGGAGQRRATRSYALAHLSRDGANRTTLVTGASIALVRPAGRISWREIDNWRQLHAAANK